MPSVSSAASCSAILALLALSMGPAEAAAARPQPVPIIPPGERFTCTPTAVWDGDGPIWCTEGPHVRLQGIAAREIDGSCRDGQPCPAASGVEARNALVLLLGGAKGSLRSGHVRVAGPLLTCQSFGSARGNRTAALCQLPGGRDLSCALVRGGTVLRWGRYGGDRLCR